MALAIVTVEGLKLTFGMIFIALPTIAIQGFLSIFGM